MPRLAARLQLELKNSGGLCSFLKLKKNVAESLVNLAEGIARIVRYRQSQYSSKSESADLGIQTHGCSFGHRSQRCFVASLGIVANYEESYLDCGKSYRINFHILSTGVHIFKVKFIYVVLELELLMKNSNKMVFQSIKKYLTRIFYFCVKPILTEIYITPRSFDDVMIIQIESSLQLYLYSICS